MRRASVSIEMGQVQGDEGRLGRRGFLAGASLGTVACTGSKRSSVTSAASEVPPTHERRLPDGVPVASGDAGIAERAPAPDASANEDARSLHTLFDAHPALGKSVPRVELGWFPSPIEQAKTTSSNGRLFVKRDDDFSRSPSCPDTFALAKQFGGGKVRKLETYFGEARALGKTRIVTSGGIGSNQALAVALLGKALGFSVRLHLTPQPLSTLTTQNLGGDAATGAEMILFDSVSEGHARAKDQKDAYVIPPGGTTALGTLGFVNAGLELAIDVREKRMPAPTRVYVALGLGGSAVGLAIGCALGGLATDIVAVRTSNPGTVTDATLRAIHAETIAYARARDGSFPSKLDSVKVRIDGRFVGAGYGAPSAAGNEAITRARETEGWALDPVYTGKALAAALDDLRAGSAHEEILFWNTMSSRPVSRGRVPAAFERFVR